MACAALLVTCQARSIVWPICPWVGETVIAEIRSAYGRAAMANAAALLATFGAVSLFS